MKVTELRVALEELALNPLSELEIRYSEDGAETYYRGTCEVFISHDVKTAQLFIDRVLEAKLTQLGMFESGLYATNAWKFDQLLKRLNKDANDQEHLIGV